MYVTYNKCNAYNVYSAYNAYNTQYVQNSTTQTRWVLPRINIPKT